VIPLVHDFAGARVLVFGGGPVGARKARRFAAEADVVVVSPAFADADFGDADRVRAAPAPDDVADWVARIDPALVVAATDDAAVNDAAAAAARAHGALCNRADRSGSRDPGSVVVPATVSDPPVEVAVTTGGAVPALSAYLRERIGGELAGAGAMADLAADLRSELRDGGLSAAERRDALRAVVRSSRVWKALRTGESNPRREAERVIRQTTGGDAGDG
jgi:precorrin-2 dehydrogenase/sirohydrochlorin ferrochelatase